MQMHSSGGGTHSSLGIVGNSNLPSDSSHPDSLSKHHFIIYL